MSDPNPENKESPEKMAVPEIEFKVDRGVMWYFVLGEAIGFSPDLGSQSDSSGKLQKEFSEHPIPAEILSGLQAEAGERGEHLFRLTYLALSPQSRRYEEIGIGEDFQGSFKTFQKKYPNLEDLVRPEFEKEKESLESRQEEYRTNFQEVIDFFQPKKSTAEIKKVTIVATGKMLSSLGTMFDHGEEIEVFDGGNMETGTHEFMHGFINAIAGKVEFSDTETEKIRNLVIPEIGKNYKKASDLLAEPLINAYLRVYSKGLSVKEGLFQKYQEINEPRFSQEMARNEHFGPMMKEIGVYSYSDWTPKKKEEFYQKYYKNSLMERCVDFYKEYAEKRKLNPFLTFEDFFKANYKKLLE